MKFWKSNETEVVEQYLHASCFNKISQKDFEELLVFESKADPIERKLIKRVKDQVRKGKIVLSMRNRKKGDHSDGKKAHMRMSNMKASLTKSIRK